MKLEGKSAIVTGSSRGVGRATALELARRGCNVLINYRRSRDEAEQVAAEVEKLGRKTVCIQADVSQEEACVGMVRAAVEEFGGLDILVNNAATTDFLPFDDLDRLTDDHWDRLFAVNVKGAFYCARAAMPHLETAAEGGNIVNVTSVAGIVGKGSSIAYCASKAALVSLTLSLARALAPNVRVNSVAPGFIEDDWTRGGLGSRYDEVKAGAAKRAALERVCQPDDVAQAIIGLVAGSVMVTGQSLVVDGGSNLGAR